MTIKQYLIDDRHPKGSPLLGKLLSVTRCALGHDVEEMKLDTWDEPWLACPQCGARFLPLSLVADDYDVVRI